VRSRGSYRLPGRRPAPRWRQRAHRVPGFSPCFRVGVFVLGAALVLAGVLLWLVSLLLCLPVLLAGLWTWSREFHWGSRLHRAVLGRAARAWHAARARPARWSAATGAGLACGAALTWAGGHWSVVDRVLALAP
jgi:hypothetical protein